MFASSGNRTRAARVAGEHSTTEPTMPVLFSGTIFQSDWRMSKKETVSLSGRCFHQIAIPREISGYHLKQKGPTHQVRPCGLMDKAPDFGSGDCRFESCHGRIINFLGVIRSKYLAPGEARTHNPGISLCTVYKYRALTDCATGASC